MIIAVAGCEFYTISVGHTGYRIGCRSWPGWWGSVSLESLASIARSSSPSSGRNHDKQLPAERELLENSQPAGGRFIDTPCQFWSWLSWVKLLALDLPVANTLQFNWFHLVESPNRQESDTRVSGEGEMNHDWRLVNVKCWTVAKAKEKGGNKIRQRRTLQKCQLVENLPRNL